MFSKIETRGVVSRPRANTWGCKRAPPPLAIKMDEAEVLLLLQGYLQERGFTETLKSLERERQVYNIFSLSLFCRASLQ